MLPFLFLSLGLFFLFGVAVTIAGFSSAQRGYEDETGFHALHEEEQMPTRPTSPRPAGHLGTRQLVWVR